MHPKWFRKSAPNRQSGVTSEAIYTGYSSCITLTCRVTLILPHMSTTSSFAATIESVQACKCCSTESIASTQKFSLAIANAEPVFTNI